MDKNNELKAQAASSPVQHLHWVEKLANEAIANSSPPFVVSAGMTTSGPFHMGTLCEFLYPSTIVRFLQKQGETKFIFSADILDAFDSVPATMSEHSEFLSPHLGKPLCDVPDPNGCHTSFGEHFLEESLALAAKFGVFPKIRKASVDYRGGAYDKYAYLFARDTQKARQVIADSSLNPNLPANWFPLMPQCDKCGRIATTEVLSFDGEEYRYSCTKDVKYTKGCGFIGTQRIKDHKYKLQWRLHWPSWMDLNGTHIEGAGMDHHTRGGSWDSCKAVFSEFFHKPHPIGYKFGFVLFGGKKYSKSKGIGMGVGDLLKLLPPEVLAYALVKPDLEENRDIVPSGENLLRLLEDYQSAAAYSAQLPFEAKVEKPFDSAFGPQPGDSPDLSRSDRKRALAYRLVSSGNLPKVAFSDLLIYHVLYHNWDVVGKKLGSPEDVALLAPYAENWEKMGMVPPQYAFSFKPSRPKSKTAEEFFSRLSPGMSALDIHNLAFETAKSANIRPGEFFVELYGTLLDQPSGPKLGKLVEAIGVEKVKSEILKTVA